MPKHERFREFDYFPVVSLLIVFQAKGRKGVSTWALLNVFIEISPKAKNIANEPFTKC